MDVVVACVVCYTRRHDQTPVVAVVVVHTFGIYVVMIIVTVCCVVLIYTILITVVGIIIRA